MTTHDQLWKNIHTTEGERLLALRELLTLSQTAIAKTMREHGHAWHQQTVARVESGDRPLRLSEAVSLARHYNLPLEVLAGGEVMPSDQAKWQSGFDAGVRMAAEVAGAAMSSLVVTS